MKYDEKKENRRLYIKFRETYLIFRKSLLEDIQQGNAKAAEEYQQLEDTWREVERWYEKNKRHHEGQI